MLMTDRNVHMIKLHSFSNCENRENHPLQKFPGILGQVCAGEIPQHSGYTPWRGFPVHSLG